MIMIIAAGLTCLACLVTRQLLNLQNYNVVMYPLWAWGSGGQNAGLLSSHHSARPHSRHAHLDHQLATGVLPDVVRQTTTHAVDRHVARAPRQLVRI